MNEIFAKLALYKATPKTTGIFSDLDGTLSEIASKPDEAYVSREMKSALERLTEKYKVVSVVTGRDVLNAKILIGIDDITYVGSHGLEIEGNKSLILTSEAEKYVEVSDRVVSELSGVTFNYGITIEKKRFGVAVHYRLAKNKKDAYRQVKDMVNPIARKYSMRIDEGRNVVELKPNLKYNKGFAVREITKDHNLKYALYIGDDITDVDAFKEMKSMRNEGWVDTICIAVSSDEIDSSVAKEADFIVKSVDSVRILLEWLSKDYSKTEQISPIADIGVHK